LRRRKRKRKRRRRISSKLTLKIALTNLRTKRGECYQYLQDNQLLWMK